MQPAGQLEILLPLAVSQHPTLGISMRNDTTFSGIANSLQTPQLAWCFGAPEQTFPGAECFA